MTTDNSNSNEQDNDIKPLFESFQWHKKEVEKANIPGYNYAMLAGQVRDIASGCATIMELIEFDYMQGTLEGGQRLMSDGEAGNLTRLAIQSLNLLNIQADDAMTWAYDYHTDAGKAGVAEGLSNHE